ncbi:DUF899 family protein [Microbacterium gorillae]|uniref:DUF899 family protein n=1 Tax=Microbacterium gorillae TaxID=1231063 RepID=UPI00058F0DFD|nr:DUF899 family protein [Microbacterium gorillae]
MRLPIRSVSADARPETTTREAWQRELDTLLVREKKHTREGDAIAAARRRLPMVEVPADATIEGPDGVVPFVTAFEGRRMLVGYFHMWHDGQGFEGQCIGCTFTSSQIQVPEYLNAADVTLAVFSEGTYAESRPYADWLGYRLPWYSARGSSVPAGRDFGFFAFFLRDDDDRVYETYWTTDRGTEVADMSYILLDRTVYGRQEAWEDSPDGWPRFSGGDYTWRIAGRPTVQWRLLEG